ncbi:MAG: nucleotidyltransferase family protein [Candidatus Coatesbacteria bacterium]|nr:nucleotidyltransferase family protein [Candidatus Coatesbacteria bacterium]
MHSVGELLWPEAELFLLLVRPVLSEAERRRAGEIAASGPDWSRFELLCRRFRLSHVVAYNLRAFKDDTIVPPDLRQRYDAFLWSAVVRNEFWMFGRELPSISQSLDASGVDAMLLKGPVVAALNYASPNLRLFGDLDFLVHLEQIDEAADALMELGFQVPESRKYLLRKNREERKTFPPLVRESSSGQSVMIDLHWTLSEKFATQESRLWEKAERHKLGSSTCLVPSSEHRLYHLCLHTAEHGFTPAVWDGSYLTMQCACDVDAIIRSDGARLDWPELQEIVSLSGVGAHLRNCLRLSEALLGTETPPQAYDALPGRHDSQSQEEWAMIAKRFLQARPDDIKRLAYTVLLRRDTRDRAKLRGLLRRCFPPVGAVARYYGVSERSPLKYLCYARRLLRPAILRKGLFLSFRLAQMAVRGALAWRPF